MTGQPGRAVTPDDIAAEENSDGGRTFFFLEVGIQSGLVDDSRLIRTGNCREEKREVYT